jgi:hypothetical protein
VVRLNHRLAATTATPMTTTAATIRMLRRDI